MAGAIVYHDPCYLGRYRDVYDEPRAVVKKSGELVEAERHRERSFCCGAGGGLAFLGEEPGERVSNVRAKELLATGAKTIGTACPFCNTMFRDATAAVDGGCADGCAGYRTAHGAIACECQCKDRRDGDAIAFGCVR